jgi:hypothetical protein
MDAIYDLTIGFLGTTTRGHFFVRYKDLKSASPGPPEIELSLLDLGGRDNADWGDEFESRSPGAWRYNALKFTEPAQRIAKVRKPDTGLFSTNLTTERGGIDGDDFQSWVTDRNQEKHHGYSNEEARRVRYVMRDYRKPS